MNIPHLPIEMEYYDGLIRYKTSAATLIGFKVSEFRAGNRWTDQGPNDTQDIVFLFMTGKGRFFSQQQFMIKRPHWFSEGKWERSSHPNQYIVPLTRAEAYSLFRYYNRLVDLESVFPDAEDA